MCSAAKVMFVVIAADGWGYWQNERGRMGCPDWDALQWAFSAEQSIGHGRSQQPLLQERGGGVVRFTVSCNAAITCSTAKLMLVVLAVAGWGYS